MIFTEFLCLRHSWQNWNQALTAAGKWGGTIRFVWLWTCAMLEPHRNSNCAFLYKGLKRNGWKYFNYMDNLLKVKCKTVFRSSSRYHQFRTIHCQILHTAQNLLKLFAQANNYFRRPFIPSPLCNLDFTWDQIYIPCGHTTNCTLFYSGKPHAIIFLSWVKGRWGNA